ncbi:hypothetical protein ACQP1G_37030 [Nocardia sp. CA-107356]|uniref:hypothetical protein n=1 Tax=Nocardia sp. CA-107356 TaxID=3239972 RepID=UPI003D94B5F6
MSEGDPFKNPFRWFFHISLLFLFGMVALSLAFQLLGQIWPWLLLVGLIVGGVVAGVAIWRARRQPW